jgi:hypothetical protein
MSVYEFCLRALQLAAVYDTVFEAEPFLRQGLLPPRHAQLCRVHQVLAS